MNEEEMNERTQEALRQSARAINQQECVVKFERLWQAVGEAIATICEQLGDLELPDMPRTPMEIKKDIKHEKNPMRLKHLNKELNESYKIYRK